MRISSVVFLACLGAACGTSRPTANQPPSADGGDTRVGVESFVRFRLNTGIPGCTHNPFGCGDDLQLSVDGRLERQKADTVVVVQVSRADLAAAVRVLTDEAFVRLLREPRACPSPEAESMELDLVGERTVHPATTCRDEPAFQAVRAEMARLRAAYSL